MKHIYLFLSAFALLALSGCSTTSSSTAIKSDYAPWAGPVFVSEESVPKGVDYEVIGSVQAEARAGYNSAESLFPLLAEEAKKIGANAVVNARGGRKVSNFSWSAPYISGTAIRVEDQQLLGGMAGTFH